MKKSFLAFLCIIFISNCIFSQTQSVQTDSIQYFDVDGQRINKTKFEQKEWKKELMSIRGNTDNQRFLVYRVNQGKITQKKQFDSILGAATHQKIDSSKPIVITYYPGKDPCNSSGTASRKGRKIFYRKMEKKIHKIEPSIFLYMYKDTTGLNDGYKNWYKDPKKILERTFFKLHYPCSSFVMIDSEGNYICFYGEPSREDYVNAAKALLEK